VTARTV